MGATEHEVCQLQAISYLQLLINDLLSLITPRNEQLSQLLQLARQAVISQIHLPYNVQDLAKALRITPVHLARTFAKQGLSNPRLFITEIKIDHAVNLLLNTRMSIKEISLSLGYDTSSHFSRSFAKITGKTPSVFRK